MTRPPLNQYDYVFLKPDGNKGVSYKYTWKPDWKNPPGVKQSKVFLGVCFWLGLAAIPVYIWPYVRGPKSDNEQKKQDIYAIMKQKNREERMKWAQSEDMPPK